MAYVKRRSSSFKRAYTPKRKYVSRFKKTYKKPVYRKSGYRKKYTSSKRRYSRR